MRRLQGRAETVLPTLPMHSFDLVLTSPPAFPSHRQEYGALGTEMEGEAYLGNLGVLLFKCRRVIRPGGFLVLVIEPVPGFNIMEPLSRELRKLRMLMLGTYRWDHGDGGQSWVLFLGRGASARLNRMAPAWVSPTWAIPRPAPDLDYGFYEWPSGLVEAILSLTIPNGGRILDPCAGKASALACLDKPFEVVAVDVMKFDDPTPDSEESGMDALENHGSGRRGYSSQEIS